MAKKLIPPRRDEAFSNQGLGTVRMLEYLEENASQTNEATEMTESDPSSVNLSIGQLSQVNKKVAELANESLASQVSLITKLSKKIEQLESTILNNSNSNLIKRVTQLENTTTSSNSNNKKLTQLENDFQAPLYKTRYNKLIVKNLTVTGLTAGEVNTTGSYSVDGVQVLTNQQSAITNPLTTVNSLQIAVISILDALRAHGAIDT